VIYLTIFCLRKFFVQYSLSIYHFKISSLDVAVCNHQKRSDFLECVGCSACDWDGDKDKKLSSKEISWLSSRNVKIRCLYCETVTDNTAIEIASFGIHLHWLNLDNQSISDISMIRIAEGCPNINSLSLFECKNITDTSVVKIAESCHTIL
jgi:hypothetical protein